MIDVCTSKSSRVLLKIDFRASIGARALERLRTPIPIIPDNSRNGPLAYFREWSGRGGG